MMKRIAIIHPFLGTKTQSGSVYKCLKIIEALKDFYDLYLITSTPKVDFNILNNQWQTNILEGDIHIKKIPLFLLRSTPYFMAFRHSFIGRYCRAHAREYDVMISAYNPYDFGVRGIQFIGDLIFSDKLRGIFHSMPDDRENSWFYKDTWWRALYLKAGRHLYSATEEGLWRNLTIANSGWMQKLLYRVLGVDSLVIYPPVQDVAHSIPWAQREEGFVTVGNLVPFKQIERSIRILQAVRGQGFDVHLHIVGYIIDQVYAHKILETCRKNANWCFYEGPLYGRDKMLFLESHKYGIHGAQVEGFGIAVAEMVKAGCVVWVAEGGGQTEILESEALTFGNEEDAVKKIKIILNDEAQLDGLRHHLHQRAQAFALDNFSSSVRRAVADFLERGNS
jgi:glycosyltransferase involved in cell wall biosynthesis